MTEDDLKMYEKIHSKEWLKKAVNACHIPSYDSVSGINTIHSLIAEIRRLRKHMVRIALPVPYLAETSESKDWAKILSRVNVNTLQSWAEDALKGKEI